jgi:hypothetical protein
MMLQSLLGLLPWKMIAKACLGKYLSDPLIKAQVMAELRAGAAKTEAKWDDAAVNTVEKMWDDVIPPLVSKL